MSNHNHFNSENLGKLVSSLCSVPGKRVLGLILLFGVIFWAFYIQIPILNEGYLNAGDDHIHVAFSNELQRIWQEEGKVLGWSRLYATGAPIFLLRPPGFYTGVNLLHGLTGISIEQCLKILVLFGFCLFPLAIFICGRMLELGFSASIFAGIVSILPISLWGHTLDAYQYLGVHKQLLAILVFPPAAGALWRLLKDGKYGFCFAALFAIMFMTHPYIAYCFALLVPCMLLALVSIEPQWNWKQGMAQSILWSIPAILFLSVWLIPFVSSQEVQVIDPYLSRRKAFDVVVCTTSETLRQFFLGGILDTARFAGPYGGSEWIGGNEWGWIDNSKWFRFPVLSFFSFIGWLIVVIRPKSSVRGFLSLGFLLSLLLFIGPDDFPFLDWIPNAKKFQNIHAVFIFEWAAIMLSGLAFQWIFQQIARIPKAYLKYGGYALVLIFLVFAYGTAIYERTQTGKKLNDVRNIYTHNGELSLRPGIYGQWRVANKVVEELKTSPELGNIAAFPLKHDDSVFYNLLPLMVNRPVFLSGFELAGGVYGLLLNRFRSDLRDNYYIQRMFNIRFVLNSPFHRGKKMNWHPFIEPIYKNQYWELVRVKGEFGDLDSVPLNFIGFIGSEREWAKLMELWLREVRRGDISLPWIISFTHSGLNKADIYKIKPFIKMLIQGENTDIPDILNEIKVIDYKKLGSKAIHRLKEDLAAHNKIDSPEHIKASAFKYEVLKSDRAKESFRVNIEDRLGALLFKRTFYRGWECRIDGKKAPIYHLSPGMQMVLISQGKHILSWHYTGPNHWLLARIAFCLGLLISAGLLWGKRIIKRIRQ